MTISGPRKAGPATRLQALPRIIARLRKDLDRERTLVPPRGCALLHWQSVPQWEWWTFSMCPPLLSLILFLQSCALMHLNRQRIRAPLLFSKWVLA